VPYIIHLSEAKVQSQDAETGCRETGHHPLLLLSGSSAATAPERHLNEVYLAILNHSISSDYTDEEKEEKEEKEELCGMLNTRLER
jgi:hypothetical protein